MALSRYNRRKVIKNVSLDYAYSDIYRDRGLVTPRQFASPNFPPLTVGQIANLQIETKMWTIGEKYFKLAHEFYGEAEYWWVIAWFNQKPLETDFTPGDVVQIPLPLEQVLEYYNIF